MKLVITLDIPEREKPSLFNFALARIADSTPLIYPELLITDMKMDLAMKNGAMKTVTAFFEIKE